MDTTKTDEMTAVRLKAVADLYETREDAAHAAGISPQQLYRYLSRENRVPFDVAIALCYEKGVSLDWVAYGASRPSAHMDADQKFARVRDSQEQRLEDRALRRAELGRNIKELVDRVLALDDEEAG